MKAPREWMDEQDVMDLVVEALDSLEMLAQDFTCNAYNEEDFYGSRGTIEIVKGGRRFSLSLNEIL